jgi:hypothetical protein
MYALHAHRLILRVQISNAFPILLNNENESRRLKITKLNMVALTFKEMSTNFKHLRLQLIYT